jgi:ankyrin repeat protein
MPDNDDELLRAVRAGSFKGVEKALASGSSPQCRTLREQTPLMLAAGCDGEEGIAIMEKLMAAGCDIEAADENGFTPLMHACANTNLEAAQLLIQKGAALNATACNGRTPIMMAAQDSKKSLGLVKHLIQQGARLEVRDDDGWSPLFFACDHMNYALIRWLLLRCGADLEERAKDGRTPLAILQHHGIGRQEGRHPRKPNLDRVLLDLDALQGKVPRANSPSSPRRQRAAARQRQHSPAGSARRHMSPAGSLSQMSPASSPRSVSNIGSSQNDFTNSSQELRSTTGDSSVRGGSPANSPPSSGRASRNFSPRSPRSRRANRPEFGVPGVPAAAWQTPEEVACKAMVHMYVPAGAHRQDCKNYKCYINDSRISNDSELLQIISEWGPSTV